eukprot:1618358-Alexandrium_andersonii.AAC.1
MAEEGTADHEGPADEPAAPMTPTAVDRSTLWQLVGEGQFSPKRQEPTSDDGSGRSTPIQQQAKRG